MNKLKTYSVLILVWCLISIGYSSIAQNIDLKKGQSQNLKMLLPQKVTKFKSMDISAMPQADMGKEKAMKKFGKYLSGDEIRRLIKESGKGKKWDEKMYRPEMGITKKEFNSIMSPSKSNFKLKSTSMINVDVKHKNGYIELKATAGKGHKDIPNIKINLSKSQVMFGNQALDFKQTFTDDMNKRGLLKTINGYSWESIDFKNPQNSHLFTFEVGQLENSNQTYMNISCTTVQNKNVKDNFKWILVSN